MKIFKISDSAQRDIEEKLGVMIENTRDSALIDLIVGILKMFESIVVMDENEKSKINLYKIIFSHSAPRDTEYGIKGYLMAHNEKEVYDYIDAEFNYSHWKEKEEDPAIFLTDDPESQETFHDRIIRLKGDINDKNRDFPDAYYGVSLYGWELIAEDCNLEDFSNFIALGIIKRITVRRNGR